MNNPILVVCAYHSGDFDITKLLLEWIAELGSCKPHSLLLAADSAVPRDKVRELINIARPVFHHVRTMIVPVVAGGWPPNQVFLAAARQVQETYKLPFLWMEPDCIPLTPNWLSQIADAYAMCPKQFMGPIIHQEGQPGLPADHLTGCSVYPNHAYDIISAIESVKTGKSAWDIGAAGVVVPKAENTELMQHQWGSSDMPPIFVAERKADDPKNFVTLEYIKPGVATFHRSKDGGLIRLLRAKPIRRFTPLDLSTLVPLADTKPLPPSLMEQTTIPPIDDGHGKPETALIERRKPGRPAKQPAPMIASIP